MDKTSIKKRKLSFNFDSSNLEELDHLINTNNVIFSDEEISISDKNNIDDFFCQNLAIPNKLISKLNSDDDNKNPNKDNRGTKNNKTIKNYRNSKSSKNSKNNRNDSSDSYSDWTPPKKSRFEPRKEDNWYDYDKYIDNNVKESEKDINVPCQNPKCDHLVYDESWYNDNKITVTVVNSLDDLIFLGSFYHCKMRVEYNDIDMKVLHTIKEPLIELNNMIGLTKIKEEIVNTIIYFLLTKNLSKEINSDMMHAVITGSPGCGKTTFIEILAKIYVGLGVLKKGHIVKTRRSELIGKYLGHTAVQTQKKIEEAYGGILLIDEAYALGNPEGRDSFSKECLDTLNQALSENKNEFICIIAGYKDALDSSFFKYNEGLKRRFPFRYEIDKYTSDELSMILLKKIEEYGHYGIRKESLWIPEFSKVQLQKLIKDNYKSFVNQGGDMESIFLGAKIAQNKRVFLLEKEEKKKLLLSDVKTAINKFLELHKLKDEHDDYALKTMYI